MQNNRIFELYKPFRNKLRKYNLIESLFIIWGYSRNYFHNLPFPDEIEKPPGFYPTETYINKITKGILDFELDFLLKQFIINCHILKTNDSLRKFNNLSLIIIYMRNNIRNEIDKEIIKSNDFLFEFHRMAHQQFIWQNGVDFSLLHRYYNIYSDTDVDSIIKNKFEISYENIMIIGLDYMVKTSNNYRVEINYRPKLPLIPDKYIDLFFEKYSISISSAREKLLKHQRMDYNLFYSYNPILENPILKNEDYYFCPIPLYIFWAITIGVYYSIFKESRFENSFGQSFQRYIGKILYRQRFSKITIYPEETYKKGMNRTSDWIITDKESIVFIECKTKRMTLNSKFEININDALDIDLKKMASFIKQIYKTYIDYKNNEYQNIKFDPTKFFIPIVLTLEEWYININPQIKDLLRKYVIEYLDNERNFDKSLIIDNPYYILSAGQFEEDVQIMNEIGILNYFNLLSKNELSEFKKNFSINKSYENDFIKSLICKHTNLQ